MTAKRVGTHKLYIYKDGGLRKIFHFIVKPVPQPKVITCNTVIGGKCHYQIRHTGYAYSWSRENMLEIESRTGKDKDYSHTIKIDAQGSGTAQVYLRSSVGSYYSHKLIIQVKANPVKYYSCSSPIGTGCDSYWYDSSEGFTYKISRAGIASLYGVVSNERTGRKKLQIKGIKEGNTDVYVYKNGEHYATIRVEIGAANPIVPSKWNFAIYPGDVDNSVLKGAGGYWIDSHNTKTYYDTQIVDVEVGKHDGKFQITAKKSGQTWIRVLDQYNQYFDFKVLVKTEENVGEEATSGKIRYIRDRANGSNRNGSTHWIEIQALEKGTKKNIARGKKVTAKKNNEYAPRPYSNITDGDLTGGNYAEGGRGENYALVDLGGLYDIERVKVWHFYPDGGSGRIYNGTKTEVSSDGKNWTVLFDSAKSGTYVEPVDGSGRSYEVKVESGGSNEEDEKTEEDNQGNLRYIRTWGNGSNVDGYTVFNEIQAIERNTGKNIAHGRTATHNGIIHEGAISNVTDGNPQTYSTLRHGLHYYQVDLGKAYDISKVNIYYYKGRKFKDTKTEVSSDGKNWTVLFDSAKSETYVEDGNGKSYSVKEVVKSASETDTLEKELETILEELGVTGLEINNVEEGINISSYLDFVEKTKEWNKTYKTWSLESTQEDFAESFMKLSLLRNSKYKGKEPTVSTAAIIFETRYYNKNVKDKDVFYLEETQKN